MPNGRTYGRSFFGEATTRLARFLGLEGEIPVGLEEKIRPVMIVGDATLPGYTSFRGRRWGAPGTNAGGQQYLATEPVIVDGMSFANTTVGAATIEVKIYGPGEWPGAAPTTPVPWIDLLPTSSEAAPVLTAAANALAGGVVAYRLVLPQNGYISIPYQMALVQGSRIHLLWTGGTGSSSCWGRVL